MGTDGRRTTERQGEWTVNWDEDDEQGSEVQEKRETKKNAQCDRLAQHLDMTFKDVVEVHTVGVNNLDMDTDK